MSLTSLLKRWYLQACFLNKSRKKSEHTKSHKAVVYLVYFVPYLRCLPNYAAVQLAQCTTALRSRCIRDAACRRVSSKDSLKNMNLCYVYTLSPYSTFFPHSRWMLFWIYSRTNFTGQKVSKSTFDMVACSSASVRQFTLQTVCRFVITPYKKTKHKSRLVKAFWKKYCRALRTIKSD